jgi:CubicO group peptidase (beta-lactamase class C family)
VTEVEIDQRPGAIYTPLRPTNWPTDSVAAAGLNAELLQQAIDLAHDNASDSLLVFRHGKLISEQYWNNKTLADVQQTFSGTKSVFSLLVGRCIRRGYLRGLDQPVRDIVTEMPLPLQQLTFRNVLAMESGMENSMRIEGLGATGLTQLEIALQRRIVASPYTQYHYNNAAYRLLFTALTRVAGMDLETLTEQEVFEPLGFSGAHWMRIYAVDENTRFTGYQSIRMTPRDFAKSSQIIVDGGKWQGREYLAEDYVTQLVESPAPKANPSFGLFHHLNAGEFYCDFAEPNRIERKLIPGAPSDTFLMFGAGGQVTAGIPSLSLVVVRTGANKGSIYEADNYIARLLRILANATT